MEYNEEGAKALLISNLIPTTLFRLDNFVSTQYPYIAVGIKSMTERLRRISYTAMMGFLKQSSLQELAFKYPDQKSSPKVNSVDTLYGADQYSGFHDARVYSTLDDTRSPYTSGFTTAGFGSPGPGPIPAPTT